MEGEARPGSGQDFLRPFRTGPKDESSWIWAGGIRLSLLTGDTLYPGLLTVQDWNAYRRSAARLAAFAQQHEVALVVGNHIEMKKAPGELYPIGTTFQPDEHALPLKTAHIEELHAACEAMADSPHRDVHDDFIIDVS